MTIAKSYLIILTPSIVKTARSYSRGLIFTWTDYRGFSIRYFQQTLVDDLIYDYPSVWPLVYITTAVIFTTGCDALFVKKTQVVKSAHAIAYAECNATVVHCIIILVIAILHLSTIAANTWLTRVGV